MTRERPHLAQSAAVDDGAADDLPKRKVAPGASAWQSAAIVGLVLVPAGMLAASAGERSYVPAAVLAPLLVLACVPWLRRMTAEGPADIAWILLVGLELRLLASIPRWLDGVDAQVYVRVGRDLAEQFRQFNVTAPTGRNMPGTGTIRYVTGWAQVVFFDSAEATTLLFTLFAFVGCVLIYRAAAIALPDMAHRPFAMALALWPSLLYWPSSIGKEAIVLLGIGLLVLGAAHRFAHDGGGLGLMLAGAGVAGVVRPHIVLLVLGALLVAVLLTADVGERRSINIGKYFLVILLAIGLALTSDFALELVESADLDTVEFLEERTQQGNSAFESASVRSPIDYPWAVITVLARPFPWEAHNATALVAAAEGTLILLVGLVRLPHLLSIVQGFRKRPLIGFALAYIAAFCFAFSSFANFGLLARQRSQALPFLLLILLLPGRARTAPTHAPETGRARRSALGWNLPTPKDKPRYGRAVCTAHHDDHVDAEDNLGSSEPEEPSTSRWRSNVVLQPPR